MRKLTVSCLSSFSNIILALSLLYLSALLGLVEQPLTVSSDTC